MSLNELEASSQTICKISLSFKKIKVFLRRTLCEDKGTIANILTYSVTRALIKAEKEFATMEKDLTSSKENARRMTAYIEDLKEKMEAQENEKIVWEWEKNGAEDTITELRQQIHTMSGSCAELQAAKDKAEQLETTIRIISNAATPKDEEIMGLKTSIATQEKKVSEAKESAAAKEETIRLLRKELKGKDEDIAGLRGELEQKEYDIRSLKSNRSLSSNVPSQSPWRRASTNQSALLRRIEGIKTEATRLKNFNQSLRDRNSQNEDAIKNLKNQLDVKERDYNALETDVNRLTNEVRGALYQQRR